MLNEATITKLNELRLWTMAQAFKDQMQNPGVSGLSFEERFGLIVDNEWATRQNKRLQLLVRQAKLKESGACIEDIDYSPDRHLDRGLISQLATCSYITENLNVIISGKTGAGKTYMACALGNSACRNRFPVLFVRLPQLLIDFAIAKGDGSYNRLMKQLKKVKLLILDDWGLNHLDINQSRDILELMETRYQQSSTIFSSQLPIDSWHDLFADSTIADATLDRIVHNSYFIDIKGKDSMRKKRAKVKLDG